MRLNWLVRIRNRNFWMTIIPALLILAQTVAAVFGWKLDMSGLSGKLLAVVDAAFVVLTILGIVVDPTTDGIGDSNRAMTYETPFRDENEQEESEA